MPPAGRGGPCPCPGATAILLGLLLGLRRNIFYRLSQQAEQCFDSFRVHCGGAFLGVFLDDLAVRVRKQHRFDVGTEFIFWDPPPNCLLDDFRLSRLVKLLFELDELALGVFVEFAKFLLRGAFELAKFVIGVFLELGELASCCLAKADKIFVGSLAKVVELSLGRLCEPSELLINDCLNPVLRATLSAFSRVPLSMRKVMNTKTPVIVAVVMAMSTAIMGW